MAYQKIKPKAGEKYRVLKRLLRWNDKTIVDDVNTKEGCVVTIRKIHSDGDFCLDNHYWSFHRDCLTTEYLELVKEPEFYFTVDKHVLDELNAERPSWMEKYMGEFINQEVTRIQPGQIFRISKEFIEEPKQTIMNKLTSALKRALSKEKQTLYKAGLIENSLELSIRGRAEYLNALFQNEGDHAKAMAEIVEMAEEELKENED